jgi:hypothetical protein
MIFIKFFFSLIISYKVEIIKKNFYPISIIFIFIYDKIFLKYLNVE